MQYCNVLYNAIFRFAAVRPRAAELRLAMVLFVARDVFENTEKPGLDVKIMRSFSRRIRFRPREGRKMRETTRTHRKNATKVDPAGEKSHPNK